ncbi:hypothetical protein [Leeuwenhoekiella nanhaiensis]|uniref:Uncharacterized protein n=1 Tax=Leeuwenhoekiella nanhaiensis TaxID=1655491 RepID=A0A2G1VQS7_9FLAO|nr:hypothetical protein [Leeuwenhoekiella nanhaiensis]PHQ29128.1 hypothetical protein CJ305_10985 [Leeuwenhoekiella nanhaiensis]
MKVSIKNSDQNQKLLYLLIENRIYDGYVYNDSFEMTSGKFINNYRLVGTLNISGRYDVKFGYKFPLNKLVLIATPLAITTALVLIFTEYWELSPIIFILIGIKFSLFKYHERKELNRFETEFLKLYKTQELKYEF